MIEDQGFDIVFNPPGDGVCELTALSIFRSPEAMRRELVQNNAVANDDFSPFVVSPCGV